jgi:hypothetical protein
MELPVTDWPTSEWVPPLCCGGTELLLPAVERVDKNPDWTATPLRGRFPACRIIPVPRRIPPLRGYPTGGRVSVVPSRPLRVIPVWRWPASRIIPVLRGRPPLRGYPITGRVSVVPPRPLRVIPVPWWGRRRDKRIRGSYGGTCQRASNRYAGSCCSGFG